MAKKNDGKLTEEELDKVYENLKIMIETMQEIYFKNLNFFEDNNKKLYKKIQKESKKILKDKSKEKYCVELNKQGAIDVINREDNSYMYKKDPFLVGDEIANKLDEKSIVFKGVGLGTHIASTIKTKNVKKVLICENNIQLFRCSMYVVDYTELASIAKKIDFNIGSKCDESGYKKVYKLKIK